MLICDVYLQSNNTLTIDTMRTTAHTIIKSKRMAIEQMLEKDEMFKTFREYNGMSQEGKTDYEIGCIHAAQVFMRTIGEIIIKLH